MLYGQLHNNLDTRFLYKERPYKYSFRNPLTTTHTTLLVQKSIDYTAASAIYQLKSYIESLNVLDTTLIGRQLTT